jgi:hypothetical protein
MRAQLSETVASPGVLATAFLERRLGDGWAAWLGVSERWCSWVSSLRGELGGEQSRSSKLLCLW